MSDNETELPRRTSRGTPAAVTPFVLARLASRARRAKEQQRALEEKQDHVAELVRFPDRHSLLTNKHLVNISEPDGTLQPIKGVIKKYNRSSILFDAEAFEKGCELPDDLLDHNTRLASLTNVGMESLMRDYGFTKAMMNQISNYCNSYHSAYVFIENGPTIERMGGKLIIGESMKDCSRIVEVQEVCAFMLHVSAAFGWPVTLELINPNPKFGGIQRWRKHVPSSTVTIENNAKLTPEDYIPHEEKLESALDMIENLKEGVAAYSLDSYDKLFEGTKGQLSSYKDDEKLFVLIVTNVYPWGDYGVGSEIPKLEEQFIQQMNRDFTNQPVTFVFLVGSLDKEDVSSTYDRLASPRSKLTADVHIVRSLGAIMESEMANHNPWLNYCIPVHLCQDLGMFGSIVSRGMKRRLTAAESKEICNMLVGHSSDLKSDDETDQIWNPMTGEMTALIDTTLLKKNLKPHKFAMATIAISVCVVVVILSQFKENKNSMTSRK